MSKYFLDDNNGSIDKNLTIVGEPSDFKGLYSFALRSFKNFYDRDGAYTIVEYDFDELEDHTVIKDELSEGLWTETKLVILKNYDSLKLKKGHSFSNYFDFNTLENTYVLCHIKKDKLPSNIDFFKKMKKEVNAFDGFLFKESHKEFESFVNYLFKTCTGVYATEELLTFLVGNYGYDVRLMERDFHLLNFQVSSYELQSINVENYKKAVLTDKTSLSLNSNKLCEFFFSKKIHLYIKCLYHIYNTSPTDPTNTLLIKLYEHIEIMSYVIDNFSSIPKSNVFYNPYWSVDSDFIVSYSSVWSHKSLMEMSKKIYGYENIYSKSQYNRDLGFSLLLEFGSYFFSVK